MLLLWLFAFAFDKNGSEQMNQNISVHLPGIVFISKEQWSSSEARIVEAVF